MRGEFQKMMRTFSDGSRRWLLTVTVSGLMLLVMSQCVSESDERPGVETSPRIRKQVKVISPKTGEKFAFGETIAFQLEHRKDVVIDSVRLVAGGKSSIEVGDSFSMNSEDYRVGSPRIKVTAYYEGGNETVFPKVTILAANPPEEFAYRIIDEYPHDPNAYTQGLFFDGERLFESTGDKVDRRANAFSSIREVSLQSGEVLRQNVLEARYFGEGCTLWDDRIYQLTYTAGEALVYDRNLELLETFDYSTQTGEGWGLAVAGDTLLMSDGSENIYMLNPLDFSEIDRIQVYDHEGKVDDLNELEYYDGALYANLYTDREDAIVVIDIGTGQVTGKINFDNIVDRRSLRGMDYVMNGTAFHPSGRLYVTGKWWPSLFHVEIVKKDNS